MVKSNEHGGKRENSGRKKIDPAVKNEKTKERKKKYRKGKSQLLIHGDLAKRIRQNALKHGISVNDYIEILLDTERD